MRPNNIQSFCESLGLIMEVRRDPNAELPPAILDQFSDCYVGNAITIFNPKTNNRETFNYFTVKNLPINSIHLKDVIDCLLTDAAFSDSDVDSLRSEMGYRHRWQAIKALRAMRENTEKLKYLLGPCFEVAMQIMT